MEKIDFTGVSPEISEYISSLEKTIEDQSKRIDNLTEMLSKIQKGIYGQSSEKTRYVLGETVIKSLYSMKRNKNQTAMLRNPSREPWLQGIPASPKGQKKSLQLNYL